MALTRLFCRACGEPVRVSGGALIAAGILWSQLWGIVPCEAATTIGMLGAASFIAIGVFRQVKVFRASSRARPRTAERSFREGG